MNFCLKRVFVPWIAFSLLSVTLSAAIAAEATPKYGPKATPLVNDHQYFRGAVAGDFWRLMPFYVPQSNDYACSAASIAIVFNAAIKGRARIAETERNITQDTLLKSIRNVPLRELVSKEGFQGRHGITLDELRIAVEETARSQNVRAQVAAHRFQTRSLKEFREILRANEENPSDFLLVHFVQDDLTGAGGGPYAHVSPIGAYDSTTHRALILDVDREWYSPYWVSDADLLAACNHVTKIWGAGGLIHIRFDSIGEPPR
ncbi:MAG: phytochelatin synthase family protein [Verrucomicrobiia bacterium]